MAYTIQHMDDVLLAYALAHLPPKDLAAASQVCKRWHKTAQMEVVWEHAILRDAQEAPVHVLTGTGRVAPAGAAAGAAAEAGLRQRPGGAAGAGTGAASAQVSRASWQARLLSRTARRARWYKPWLYLQGTVHRIVFAVCVAVFLFGLLWMWHAHDVLGDGGDWAAVPVALDMPSAQIKSKMTGSGKSKSRKYWFSVLALGPLGLPEGSSLAACDAGAWSSWDCTMDSMGSMIDGWFGETGSAPQSVRRCEPGRWCPGARWNVFQSQLLSSRTQAQRALASLTTPQRKAEGLRLLQQAAGHEAMLPYDFGRGVEGAALVKLADSGSSGSLQVTTAVMDGDSGSISPFVERSLRPYLLFTVPLLVAAATLLHARSQTKLRLDTRTARLPATQKTWISPLRAFLVQLPSVAASLLPPALLGKAVGTLAVCSMASAVLCVIDSRRMSAACNAVPECWDDGSLFAEVLLGIEVLVSGLIVLWAVHAAQLGNVFGNAAWLLPAQLVAADERRTVVLLSNRPVRAMVQIPVHAASLPAGGVALRNIRCVLECTTTVQEVRQQRTQRTVTIRTSVTQQLQPDALYIQDARGTHEFIAAAPQRTVLPALDVMQRDQVPHEPVSVCVARGASDAAPADAMVPIASEAADASHSLLCYVRWDPPAHHAAAESSLPGSGLPFVTWYLRFTAELPAAQTRWPWPLSQLAAHASTREVHAPVFLVTPADEPDEQPAGSAEHAVSPAVSRMEQLWPC